MEPKEKAQELVSKMEEQIPFDASPSAVQCALIAVDEILKVFDNEWTKLDFWTEEIGGTIEFWKDVRKEIEKL